jgi:Ca2+-binding EF-hand superfamily protein
VLGGRGAVSGAGAPARPGNTCHRRFPALASNAAADGHQGVSAMKHRMLKVVVVALPAVCGFALAAGVQANNNEHKDAMFQMMDSNGDGKISAEEHEAGAKKMFQMMDADKDGKVTASEMDAAHERMTGKSKTQANSDAKSGMKGHEMSANDKIKAVDTNHDGVVTADEHEAGAKAMFDKMDTDKDGYLTKSEMEAGHAKLMSKPASKKQSGTPAE